MQMIGTAYRRFVFFPFKRRLDVKTDPVNQRQNFRQMLRPVAAGMQSDQKAQFLHFGDGRRQTVLHQRLAAGKNDAVQNAAPGFQKFDKLFPDEVVRRRGVLQKRVVTERTPPRTALIMFTLLATAGYYIGNAVAQNKTSADQQAPDGVLVVEETYGVAVPVQAASPTADSAAGSAAGTDATTPAAGGADGKNAATPVTGSNNDGNGNTVVEETVTEEGYVEE